jgi:hypothetical protein
MANGRQGRPTPERDLTVPLSCFQNKLCPEPHKAPGFFSDHRQYQTEEEWRALAVVKGEWNGDGVSVDYTEIHPSPWS